MTPLHLMLDAPFSNPEIVAAFAAEIEAIDAFFGALADDIFFAAPPGVWSPAENLVHLNQSSAPVIRALALPRFVIRIRFGKAKHASRSLVEVRDEYTNVALAGGGVASGDYIPVVTAQSATEKGQILATWRDQGAKLVAAIPKWPEADLDKLALPHPLLGKMTVREILFFTLYHNLHHVNDVRRLLGIEESEWFAPGL